MPNRTNLKTDLWNRLKKLPNGCWEWTGYRNKGPTGYGSVMCEGTIYQTHRLAWELTHGPIPKGLCVLHKCDNRGCCNPEPLFLGTQADNIADCRAKGRARYLRGTALPQSKLTEDDIPEIRSLSKRGFSHRAIAERMPVRRETIGKILRGERWKHVCA